MHLANQIRHISRHF